MIDVYANIETMTDVELESFARALVAEVKRLREESDACMREAAECAKIVAQTSRERDGIRAERDALRTRSVRHGECVGCNYNDGPEEFCPQHGRPYNEVLDIADRLASERDAARAEAGRAREALQAVRDALHLGDDQPIDPPNVDRHVAYLDGWDDAIDEARRLVRTALGVGQENQQ